MKLWTQNFQGNVHTAAAAINDFHPHLVECLVSLDSDGYYSIAVFRVSEAAYAEMQRKQAQAPGVEEPLVVAGGADGLKFSLEEEKA